MEPVYIAGVSMTNFGVWPSKSIKDLTREAVIEALQDANATLGDVGAAFFGNVAQGLFEGQSSISGQVALRSMGFERIPIYNVENACATGTTAFNLAVTALRAGTTDVALAVGAEKMNIDDMSKVMASFEGGFDVHDKERVYGLLDELGGADAGKGTGHRTAFMEICAATARVHMKAFGTTQKQLALVASKNHFHSTMNPKAHFHMEMPVESILAARAISFPLTVPMCSPMTDGAAAAVLCTGEGLKRLQAFRPVQVLATLIGTGTDRRFEQWDQSTSRLAALRAYDEAGVGPDDISVAEVHDAASFDEILQSEYLGFCEIGGGALAESGATRLGGRIPINTSGGLESKGHPIGATDIAQLYELVCQLRGEAGDRQVEGARLALAENGGGMFGCEEAVAAVTILGN